MLQIARLFPSTDDHAAADLPAWVRHWETVLAGDPPIERAVRAAATAGSIAQVFAVSYRAALVALTGLETAAALCVTEAEGNHPRALKTTAVAEGDAVRICGTKQWSTFANHAETLLVAAVEGETEGRPAIGVYAVPAEAATLTAMPPTPFIPEVPHFQVQVDVRVPAEARLAGDGWADLVKPFRTVEDIFVTAGLAAFAMRRLEPATWAAILAGLLALAEADPSDAGTHLALDGLLAQAHARIPALAATNATLERDLAVMRIGSKARAKRAARARERLGL